MAINKGNIGVFLGPLEQGSPDSLLTPIINFIDKSKKKTKVN